MIEKTYEQKAADEAIEQSAKLWIQAMEVPRWLFDGTAQ